MNEEDVELAQHMIDDMVRLLNQQKALLKRQQDIVVKYQKLIVNHITGIR